MRHFSLSGLALLAVCGSALVCGSLAEAKPAECQFTKIFRLQNIHKIDIGKRGNSVSINADYTDTAEVPGFDGSKLENGDLPFCAGVDRDAGQVMLNQMTDTMCSSAFNTNQAVSVKVCGGPVKCINAIELTYLLKEIPANPFVERAPVPVGRAPVSTNVGGANRNSQ